MSRVRALLVPAAAGALLVASAAPVSAGGAPGPTLTIDPIPATPIDRETATFDLQIDADGDAPCEASFAFEVVDEADDPVTDFEVQQGVLSFGPSVPGGIYEVTVSCTSTGGPLEDTGDVAFARGHVEKVVDGDAPADAVFVIEVICEGEGAAEEAGVAGAGPDFGPFTLEFEYGPEGGDEHLIVYSQQLCVAHETERGGADETVIEGEFASGGGDFTFGQPRDETVTVTNTFAAAAEPPAALPEQAAPDFTG